MMLISLLLILIAGINIGYEEWTLGSPLPLTHRLDLMPEHYLALQTSPRAQLLNFFTFSDIHITDKEAPNQLIYFQQAERFDYQKLYLAAGLDKSIPWYPPIVPNRHSLVYGRFSCAQF